MQIYHQSRSIRFEDELLWANIDVIVEAHASGTGAEPPHSYAFTRCITKKLLRRTHDRVLELINNGTVARAARCTRPWRGTLYKTMARVILGCAPAHRALGT